MTLSAPPGEKSWVCPNRQWLPFSTWTQRPPIPFMFVPTWFGVSDNSYVVIQKLEFIFHLNHRFLWNSHFGEQDSFVVEVFYWRCCKTGKRQRPRRKKYVSRESSLSFNYYCYSGFVRLWGCHFVSMHILKYWLDPNARARRTPRAWILGVCMSCILILETSNHNKQAQKSGQWSKGRTNSVEIGR